MLRKLGVTVLGLVAIATALSIVSHFRIAAGEATEEKRVAAALARSEFSVAELHEDIAQVRIWLATVHPEEIPVFPLAQIDEALERAEASIVRPVNHKTFYQKLAPAVHALNDEHTMLFPPDRARESSARKFPFEIAIVDGQPLIRAGAIGDVGPGDQIQSINDLPAERIIDSLSSNYAGTDKRQRLAYLEDDFDAALSLDGGTQAPYSIVVHDRVTEANTTVNSNGVLRTPVDEPAFELDMIRRGTLLFSYNAFEDDEGQFDDFLEGLFATARHEDVETLIIDLRRNRGGATEFGDRILEYLTDQPFTQLTRVDVRVSELAKQEFLRSVPGFLRWIPIQYIHPILRRLWTSNTGDVASVDFEEISPTDNPLRFHGDVYVLIGPRTMSSASLFAAAVRHYGIGTLVGEKTGGYTTMYGNIIDARLPNTGLKVWMPTSVVYGHGAGPVEPDHEVRDSAKDIAETRDAALEYVLFATAGQRNSN